jgi:hypothetical protein
MTEIKTREYMLHLNIMTGIERRTERIEKETGDMIEIGIEIDGRTEIEVKMIIIK